MVTGQVAEDTSCKGKACDAVLMGGVGADLHRGIAAACLEKRNSPAAPSVNWLDIFDAFVGDDVAVMEKYQAMPVATAFRLLNKRIRDAQKQKK